MVDYVIDANSAGSFTLNVGNNGTDDTVTINFGTNFYGTAFITGEVFDGEIETIVATIPEGWTITQTLAPFSFGNETPAHTIYSYTVFDENGVSRGTLNIQTNITSIPCFTSGTMIETVNGPRRIEDLTAGDMVITRDNGPQPIRWIGKRALTEDTLDVMPNLRAIRIRAGALGENSPAADLLVSPQHRMLVRSRIAQRLFGTDEVLVAAKQLLQVDGIDVANDLTQVEYFHMLFDRHEIVIANGAESESLYTGAEALKSVGPAARNEIFALFPELRDTDYMRTPARVLASGRQGRRLAMRHAQNEMPLVN